MFGRVLEQVWGGKRFLIYYLFTGLGAATLHIFVTHLEMSSLLRDVTALTNTPSAEVFAGFLKEHIPKSSPSYLTLYRPGLLIRQILLILMKQLILLISCEV